ncbi:ribonucleoside-diphosphate reductase, adenosylcobalamin-dependent [Candidatus Micrarchaeota archaeon]|nr:MAG: ribonucleoside-diphosphate reductase, adenosylcobalamin-dependent [Candidatus Micrarchaeota archaeon]
MSFTIKFVRKRDGRVVPFDKSKIATAIWKAEKAVGGKDRSLAEKLADRVIQQLEERFKDRIPTVEEIQDIVEKVLIESGRARTAKAYILYRQKRTEIREEKKKILEKEQIDEVDKAFDLNALRVLRSRYLKKDEKGRLVESPKELFIRVATHVGIPSIFYDERLFRKEAGEPFPEEAFDPKEYAGKVSIGKYKLNEFHLEALKRLYDRMNREGKVKLSWSDFFEKLLAGEFDDYEKEIDMFYDLMVSKRFLPNTPALANFGNYLGMGSACFVLDIDDSLESIMDTLKNAALIFKAGGGVGYNFSKLRPEGDFVRTTSGIASGPVSFMRLFDTMTEVIKQGGIRRGANMGILNIDHPDIQKFIKAKEGNKALKNFNISVLVHGDFWKYHEEGKPYPLVNPRTNKPVAYVDPKQLIDMIAYQAWESAEPGVIFEDKVNEFNPLYEAMGPIVSTNPCGEVLLYPNESCNLGSINVWAFVKEKEDGNVEVDWDGLKETVIDAVRFLDNVIDINKYPLKQIEEMTLKTRKIGLGIMGLADLLFELQMPYNSEEGRKFMERLMEFVNYYSKIASVDLAEKRGPFPLFEKSRYKNGEMPFAGFYNLEDQHFDWQSLAKKIAERGIRNAYTTVIAPTGSISMIAGCSSGIEPVFALVYEKSVTIGSFQYVDPVFEKVMRREGLYDNDLLKDVIDNRGSIQRIPYIPDQLKRIFITALDIDPIDHVKALAAFQKWVDSSISKTINMPSSATTEDVKKVYLLAYKLGCKDVTVYRDKSLPTQVLKATTSETNSTLSFRLTTMSTEEKNGAPDRCPSCGTSLIYKEGCAVCPFCGWSACISA